MTEVLFEGIIIGYFVYFLSFPPFLPEKQNVLIFFLFAIFAASIRFSLFPEVVIAIAMSPLFPMASICLENMFFKAKSFPVAVIIDVSVANEIAGKATLLSYFTTIQLLNLSV